MLLLLFLLKFQVVDAMWSMYVQHRKGAWSKAAAWGYAIFAYRDNVGQQKFRNSKLVVSRIPSFWGSGNWARGLGLSNYLWKIDEGDAFCHFDLNLGTMSVQASLLESCSCSISHVLVFYQYTLFYWTLSPAWPFCLVDGWFTELKIRPQEF